MIHGKLDVKPTDLMLKDRNLEEYGKVQRFIDTEVIRNMEPYTPNLLGVLYKSAKPYPRAGSGQIIQSTPYGKFHYYGKVMVSPTTGSPWALKGEKKVLTDRSLVHNKSKHPLAGPFWFERMKSDKKDEILQGARKIAGTK